MGLAPNWAFFAPVLRPRGTNEIYALIIDAGALAGEEGDMATECVCNLGCVTSTEKSLQSHTSII